MPTGGEVIAAHLAAEGVDRIFCVPGESHLALLDALRCGGVDIVTCRQEGGACMAAEADARLTGRVGVCLVTRGPGATNAAAGLHVAFQDGVPLILLVGQVEAAMRGREAFQELDYPAAFGAIAKAAFEIDRPEVAAEIMSRAFATALSGRPGPVVVAMPEDSLTGQALALDAPMAPFVAPIPHPAPEALAQAREMIAAARAPLLVLGGERWRAQDRAAVEVFAASHDLPVAVEFRRQRLIDPQHLCYAGDLGLGISPRLRARAAQADLVILLGGRFGEIPSQSYDLLEIPQPSRRLIHIHPEAAELGKVYRPDLAVQATPGAFLSGMGQGGAASTPRSDAAHTDWAEWSTPAPRNDANGVCLSAVMAHLHEAVSETAIFCNGAGNYAAWLQRFRRKGDFFSQLAPGSGSMGYGLPAAIAAALRAPDRDVICLAGDGCFQMTMQEFGVAAERGLPIRLILCDNGLYGTIRMHQAREYPGRAVATALWNPDFAALARAYGAFAETVTRSEDFGDAFARACAATGPALLHLKTDPDQVSPALRLSEMETDST